MAQILHLGVVDLPYVINVVEKQRRQVVRKRPDGTLEAFSRPPAGGETTGDVATWLEDKYHVMEVFYEDVGPALVAKSIEVSARNALESFMLGGPSDMSLTAAAESEIEQAFRIFLDQQEMDNVVGGVPTKAALAGVNHRLKHPYAKANKERPSFIDTGTYQKAFKVWVDGEG